jgi:tetratricopeptide (TPR) repeat protein
MNRSILLIIVFATVLTGGLYSLPKVVVNTKERKLVGAQESTTTSEEKAPKENSRTSVEHSAPLTSDQQSTVNKLFQQYISAADSRTKSVAALKLSDFYVETKKLDSAAKYAEQVAILEPSESNILMAGDRYFNAFGFAADDQKLAKLGAKARDWYQKAIDKNPNLLNVKANLAMTYVSTETPMQGIMMLREVLAADPTNEVALFNLGMLSMRSNQYEKATERFRQLLKIRPENTKARFYLGVSLAQIGKNKEALEELAIVKEKETDPTIQSAIAELEKELK